MTTPRSTGSPAANASTTASDPRQLDEQHLKTSADGVEFLVALVREMNPYLDLTGTPRCRVKSDNAVDTLDFRLRDRSVRAVIGYLCKIRHGAPPSRERVAAAIDFVEGQLLSTRSPGAVLTDCPTTRCFRRLLEDEESGQGSAEEILGLLRSLAKTQRLLRGAECLPDNATAMGKWLTRSQLRLRTHGIELTRPGRRATKRLWAWQLVVPDDGCDAMPPQASPLRHDDAASQTTSPESPDDTMTDDFLLQTLGESCDANSPE